MSDRIPGKYNGWRVYSLSNPFIRLHVAPQLGGRIIQMEFYDYSFFYVNKALAGTEPESLGHSENNGAWLNFGGEKIWPAPQGWDSPDHWPGPPDPVLDGGSYGVPNLSKGTNPLRQIRLVSEIDEYTGLQIEKDIVLSDTRSEVIINATFTNKSKLTKQWSIWPVFQLDTPETSGGRYQVVCPVNPSSQFEKGYFVMHGLVNNPQNQIRENGLLCVDFQYLIGKIGLDSDGNWVAFLDKKTGKAFVTTYTYHREALYPENCSVQIWTQGRGQTYSRNRINDYPDDIELNQPYMEIELLSPLQQIHPESAIQFQYSIKACTIGTHQEISKVTEHGIISQKLNISFTGDEALITGGYGVFINGKLYLKLKEVSTAQMVTIGCWDVNPFGGISISLGLSMEHFSLGKKLVVELQGEDSNCIVQLDELNLWEI